MSSFYRLSLKSSWSLLLLLFIAGAVYGQDTTNISITGRNMPISGFIRQLESKTGFSFIYGKAAFDDQERVSLTLSNVGLSEALSALFKGKNLSWQYREKTVILSRQAPQNSQVTADSAPQYSVAGTVVDPQGNPIEGASVALRGQSRGQGTNSKGEFSFSGIPENAVLVVSSIGYATKQLRLSGQREVRVALDTLVHEIEGVEVVSTGYQDIPKERATGSFYKLDNELINRSVSTNVLDRIVGVTSGFNFQPTTDPLGKRGNVTIRGVSTINANNQPLIVVDGFPYEEGDRFSGFFNRLNNLNPNDVESITILKDAAAASIWGARSGNGVIVITTRKGRLNQRTKVMLNANINIGDKPDLYYQPALSSGDFIDIETMLFNNGFYDEALNNTLSFPIVSPVVEILSRKRDNSITDALAGAQISAYRKHDFRSDINKYLRQKSVNQQYNVNISGGGANFSYYASAGYDQGRSTSVGNKNDRFTFRFDNTYNANKKITITSFINYAQSESVNNGIGNLQGSPYLMLADSKGTELAIPQGYRQSYIDTARFPALLDWKYRPLQELRNSDNVNKQYDIRLGGNVRYLIFSGLNIEGKFQYQKTLYNRHNHFNPETYFTRNLINRYMQVGPTDEILYPVPNGGIVDRSSDEATNWNGRAQINYNINRNSSNLVALAGAEIRQVVREGKSADRVYGYDANTGTIISQVDYESVFPVRPEGAERVPTRSGPGTFENTDRYLSYFVNAAYTYDNKYTLSGSARTDGSNFFGIKTNQKVVPLWSTGLGWDISNEPFYAVSWLPYLKWRLTYGFNGNMLREATAFTTLRYRIPDPTSLNGGIFAEIETPGNPQLSWEKVRTVNVGIDFESKKGLISGSLEYYSKRGINLIGPIIVSPITGFIGYTGNRANMKGQGIDLMLNVRKEIGKFLWISNFLFSYNKDELTKYETAGTESSKDGFFSGLVIGKPLDALYSYRSAGLDPGTGDPRIYVGDSIVNYAIANSSARPSDLMYNGTQSPILFGSFRNSISWNGFSLSFNLIYKFSYYFRRASIRYSDLLTTYSLGTHVDYLNRWKKPGDEIFTNIPSFPDVYNTIRDAVYASSSILIERGDHIRLQDIRISYNLSKEKFNALPFLNIQIYGYLNNIGIVWRANKYGIDPDFPNAIPNPRSVAIGLNVIF